MSEIDFSSATDDQISRAFEQAREMSPTQNEEGSSVPPKVEDFLQDVLARMERRSKGLEQPIPLPWSSMAAALGGGLWPGLHILVGNTASGKSQFALQASLHAAQQGVPVAYVGLELGEIDLVPRLLGLLADDKWSNLFLGKKGLSTAKAYAPRLKGLPFHLEMAPSYGWPYTRLHTLAETMRDQYPHEKDATGAPVRGSRPFLVVLDFLQLVAPGHNQREELRQRIQQAAYAGRIVARDLDAAVLLISSTARENYAALAGQKGGQELGEGEPVRMVGLGKESGEIEYGADSVLVLARKPWTDEQPPADGTCVWIAIAKVRAGKPGWVEMRFNGGHFWEPQTGREGKVSF
jgi:replicative DNA helicase